MFAYVWPIALAVLSNVAYHVCTRSVPEGTDPFASLTVTYLIAAAASGLIYFFLGGRSLLQEYHKLNWAPFALGIVIVGLEAGFIFAYRAGWQISTASVVQGAVLAVALLFVGALFYRETLTWNKLIGAAICMIGLVFINYR